MLKYIDFRLDDESFDETEKKTDAAAGGKKEKNHSNQNNRNYVHFFLISNSVEG